MFEDPISLEEEAVAPPFDVERRFMERYRCCRQPTVRVLAKPSFQPFQARVFDASLRGLGLILDRAFEAGTVLAIQLQTKHAGFSGILSAHVRHCTKQPDGTFRVGCVLSRTLTDDEFFALL